VTGRAAAARFLDDRRHALLVAVKPLYREPVFRLAAWRRRRLAGTAFVAVTGSTAKTTTKELTAAVLQARFRGSANRGSSNHAYMVARNVLLLPRGSRFFVQELGAAGPGTLDPAIELLRPAVAVVTNVGLDHYREFRGPEGVAAEKVKVVAALPPQGVAILNADDPRVLAMGARCPGRVLTFGLGPGADLRAVDLEASWPERLSFTAVHEGRSLRVRTQLLGAHWAHAVLAALGAGLALGVPLEAAAEAVAAVPPTPGRMSPVETPGGAVFVRDDRKASLPSVEPALEFLRAARAARRIAVIGTLSDYPGQMEKRYVRVARAALEAADLVLFVGRNAHGAMRAARGPGGERLRAFSTLREVHDVLGRELRPGDLVLLKGSQGADHLQRLALEHVRRVGCWRTACGRRMACERCRLLAIPAGERAPREIGAAGGPPPAPAGRGGAGAADGVTSEAAFGPVEAA
jgi:UDP-N-acetylmuramyl pentapeptide synthase